MIRSGEEMASGTLVQTYIGVDTASPRSATRMNGGVFRPRGLSLSARIWVFPVPEVNQEQTHSPLKTPVHQGPLGMEHGPWPMAVRAGEAGA